MSLSELKSGMISEATDKLNSKHRYKVVEMKSGYRGIKLWNLDFKEPTEVEVEWFERRSIRMIDQKGNFDDVNA